MKHLTDLQRQALDSCIEKCEEFSTLGEMAKKVCVPGQRKECKRVCQADVDKANECVTSSRECAKQCEEHMRVCKDPACILLCQKCVTRCHSVVAKLTKLTEHETPESQEIDSCIASCRECIDACNQMFKIS